MGFGMTSRLNKNSGTQNAWMTSADSNWNSMRLPAGNTNTGISELVPRVSTLSKFR